jgi:RNA-binding protein
MITGKQRSYLKGLAHHLDPMVHIGKFGLSENVLSELDIALENKELVKVKLQEGSDMDPKTAAHEVCAALKAEFVQSIGKKFTVYRESKEHKVIVLPKERK